MAETRKVRIQTDGSPLIVNWRVFIDDIDISSIVQGIEVSAFIHDVAKVRIHCIGFVEWPEMFPTDAIEIIQTIVDKVDAPEAEWIAPHV